MLAQEGYVVRVWLADKRECGYSTDNPQEFLSDRSIARHSREQIEISEQDLPITQHYKQEVMNMAQRIVTYSNWLNTLVAECDSNNIQQIKQLPFVKKVEVLSKAKVDSVDFKLNFYSTCSTKRHPLYGVSHPIAKSAKVATYHKRGKWGEGIYVAVLDAGFGEIEVGLIPGSVDRVVVGDVERSRLKQVKALFFLGVNDGNIPKGTSKGGIISDIDREFLAQSHL